MVPLPGAVLVTDVEVSPGCCAEAGRASVHRLKARTSVKIERFMQSSPFRKVVMAGRRGVSAMSCGEALRAALCADHDGRFALAAALDAHGVLVSFRAAGTEPRHADCRVDCLA